MRITINDKKGGEIEIELRKRVNGGPWQRLWKDRAWAVRIV